jgi:hypothetical protein
MQSGIIGGTFNGNGLLGICILCPEFPRGHVNGKLYYVPGISQLNL